MDILGLVCVPNWIISLLVFLTVLYFYYTWNFGVIEKLGLPGPKPYPILGNNDYIFKYGFFNASKTIVEQYGKIVGIYMGRLPTVIVADVDILKRILIKDFPTFENRMHLDARGLFKKSLFDSRGENWRNLRHLMTPAFTTGKLKQMLSLIDVCGDRFVDNMAEKCRKKEEFEAKEYCGAFSMDVIANTAFGLDVDSQKNKDDQFVKHAKKLLNIQFTSPVLLLSMLFPFLGPLFNWLDISMFPSDCINFFAKVVKDTLKMRRQGQGVRVDFLQLMLEAEKHVQETDDETKADLKSSGVVSSVKGQALSEEDILAQALLFFAAGYDTTASTMSFLLYHLATHPHVQDRLVKEISQVMGDKTDPSRDDLANLPYLDMCINETLRLFPPIISVDREANTDFEYNGIKIPKGTIVIIPIRALQSDPDIWPEPEKFDPERFSPEVKESREPLYFLPFGMGPRQCIGMRLAQLEMKMTMVKFLRRFKVLLSDKTEVPIRVKNAVLTQAEGGIWLKVEEHTKA